MLGAARPLTTVDVGKWRCGLGLWDLNRACPGGLRANFLIGAAEVSAGEGWAPPSPVYGTAIACVMWAPYGTRWVAETPQSYPGKQGREGDLDALRGVLDEIERLTGDRVKRLRPWKWKGNVPKAIHQQRVMEALYEQEAAIVKALPRTRDALDAVGLGLYYLGRTGRGGAPQRTPR